MKIASLEVEIIPYDESAVFVKRLHQQTEHQHREISWVKLIHSFKSSPCVKAARPGGWTGNWTTTKNPLRLLNGLLRRHFLPESSPVSFLQHRFKAPALEVSPISQLVHAACLRRADLSLIAPIISADQVRAPGDGQVWRRCIQRSIFLFSHFTWETDIFYVICPIFLCGLVFWTRAQLNRGHYSTTLSYPLNVL